LAYTTRFVDGLSKDIRVVVLVARPTTLDVVYTLALLQEEAGGLSRYKDSRRQDISSIPKYVVSRGGTSLPPQHARAGGDKAWNDDKLVGMKPPSVDDKLSTLKSFPPSPWSLHPLWREMGSWSSVFSPASTSCSAGSLGVTARQLRVFL